MSTKWYVLHSKPNKEMALWHELLARRFECFFPHFRVRPVDPRNRSIRPYFPGYVFLRTDIEEVGLTTFQWMPFACGLISFDSVPAYVPDHLVAAIRRRVEQINAAGDEQMLGLERGDEVTVHGGPFEGYEAIFDARLPGSERVRVLLMLLQRQMCVELPAAFIRKKQQRTRFNGGHGNTR